MYPSFTGRNSDSPTQRSDQPLNYTPAPDHLITSLQDSPLAIGLYMLIARRYFIARAAVPLSAADMQRYDPTVSRGAFLRAIARLTSGGWLVEQQQRGGKTCYTPTWGIVKGQLHLWRLGAPALGRPNHVKIVRVDQRLFDICLGKLETLACGRAIVSRYFTRPLLVLADIGAYALTLRRIPTPTPTLELLGLIVAGEPRPLLGTYQLLALASQGALGDRTIALTADGVRLLGTTPIPPAHSVDRAQPLFFVPPHLIGMVIGGMIGGVIGQGAGPNPAPTASVRAKTQLDAHPEGITWINMDQRNQGNSPPIPPTRAGGGTTPVRESRDREPASDRRRKPASANQDSAPPPIDPERRALITALAQRAGELIAAPEKLRDAPPALLAAWRDAIGHPGLAAHFRSPLGFAVRQLERGLMPPPRAVLERWSGERSDSPKALEEAFARYEAELETERAAGSVPATVREAVDTAAASVPQAVPRAPDPLTERLRAALKERVGRSLHPVIDRLTVREHREAIVFCCGFAADLAVVQKQLASIAAPLLREGGETRPLRVIPLSRQEEVRATDEDDGRPLWITPASWAGLSPSLRVALIGAVLEGGAVRGRSTTLTQLLYTRYGPEIDRLLLHDR